MGARAEEREASRREEYLVANATDLAPMTGVVGRQEQLLIRYIQHPRDHVLDIRSDRSHRARELT